MSRLQPTLRIAFEVMLVIAATEIAVMHLLPLIVPDVAGAAYSLIDSAIVALVSGPIVLGRIIHHVRKYSESDSDVPDRGTYLAVAATFGIGFCMTAWTVRETGMDAITRTQTQFASCADRLRFEVEQRAERFGLGLRGVSALFHASLEVDRDEFHAYAESSQWQHDVPGAQGIGFAQRVLPSDLPDFLDALKTGVTEIEAPANVDSRDELVLIKYFESAVPTSGVIGFDLSDDDQFMRDARRAARTGRPILTMSPRLAHRFLTHSRYLCLAPVYATGVDVKNSADRYRHCIGWAFVPICSTEALAGLPDVAAGNITATITDLTDPDNTFTILEAGQQQHATATESSNPDREFKNAWRIDASGRDWLITVVATAKLFGTVGHTMTVLAGLGGTLLTLTLTGMVWTLATGRSRALAMARAMNSDLERLAMVARRTQNGVVVTNADREIEWVNEGFTRITGYTLDEVRGRTPDEVLIGPATDATEAERIRGGVVRGESVSGELVIYTQDGDTRTCHMMIEPLIDESGQVTGSMAVQTDVTDLVRARNEAEAANDAKTRFLAGMSHEIRTPLNGIIGFSDLLQRGADGDDFDQRREWVGIIHGSAQHLLELLNDALDLSKMDVGKMDICLAPCNPRQVISESVLMLKSRANERGIALGVEFDDDVPVAIRTDATRLRQIVMNLATNSVKFTETGGVKVRVSVDNSGAQRQLLVQVTDTGIGITEEQLDQLFIPFQQADKTISRRFGGTGLGLSISRQLANRLGGDIQVESKVGVGSVFTLNIDAPPLLPNESLPRPLPEGDSWDREKSDGTKPLAGKRILVVDDIDANRKVCAIFLRRAGAEVITAEDGHSAVNMCFADRFDAVLMDVQMPTMSGIEAARQIRKRGFRNPIIAATAFSSGVDREACLNAGMNDFLPKPIQPTSLIQSVQHWIGQPLIDQVDAEDVEVATVALQWLRALPECLATIQSALLHNDCQTAARMAHSIKGSGGSLGLPEFTAPAAELDNAANRGDIEVAQLALAMLRRIHNETSARIDPDWRAPTSDIVNGIDVGGGGFSNSPTGNDSRHRSV